MSSQFKILVLPGDGTGPEVISCAVKVLDNLCADNDIKVDFEFDLLGGQAFDKYGTFCRDETVAAAKAPHAVLVGSVGGPQWNNMILEGSAGWFMKPTIFGDVTPEMPVFREEIFGPVIAALKFHSEEEAIRIANDSGFGLAAGIWTEDHRRAIRLADKIDAGTVYINNYFNACTHSPVGGFKQSGYGRENGWKGLKDYVQSKSVWLSTA